MEGCPVREVGRSGRPRWCAAGAATRRRGTLAAKHTSNALGRGRGEDPHAEGLRREPGRQVVSPPSGRIGVPLLP